MRSERYQIALICLGLAATAFFAHFFYKEMFPEYRIYQNDYIALEEFRSTYTGDQPPEFKSGVKQIVFERDDKGPARIDRCVSCHVALQLPHFSPTTIAHDINGNIIRDSDGRPKTIPNENYVWARLDKKIAELTDEQVIKHLKELGEESQVKSRLAEAKKLSSLKVAEVHEQEYDVTKVLVQHPLIGKETRPFEFHPLDDYGCTSCHSGNGRGLTTDKAHGPVFDGYYEAEFTGHAPQFTEHDKENDPRFAKVFNAKPSDALLFQTTPILVGSLIEAKCVQCHQQSFGKLQGIADSAGALATEKKRTFDSIKASFEDSKALALSLFKLKELLTQKGLDGTIKTIKDQINDPSLLSKDRSYLVAQLAFLEKGDSTSKALLKVDGELISLFGSLELADSAEKATGQKGSSEINLNQFIKNERNNPLAKGAIFVKADTYDLEEALLKHVEETHKSLSDSVSDESTVSAMTSDIDLLTSNFERGKNLFLSQGCYACHRIAGFTRGGIGPELTKSGDTYPWFLKGKLVWPQADLKTSTMPNYKLDTEEIEDLMTFLLAQKGPTKVVSDTDYKIAIQQWEAGRKMEWEKPLSPSQVHNLRDSMKIFASQGCAACHRLEGFDSNIGFASELNEKETFNTLYADREWFQSLFPEEIRGTDIVAAINTHQDEIDKRIVDGVRKGALLEEIEAEHPELIESYYSNFRFAARAKNHLTDVAIVGTNDPKEKSLQVENLKAWKERVHRVLMTYVQVYGLGRLIGPKPNWSGVYRSDEWLMEHFKNPASHVPRSIMPIFPFDETKFYALTYMLDVLGEKNRKAVAEIWENKGFEPELAYKIHCAECHGDYLQGNGPVATWIYPIPKNLRNAEFLRNLTKEKAIESIVHGVKGTPMPPWGETPKDKINYEGKPVLTLQEIEKLVDWLYSSIPGGTVIRGQQDVPKWNYNTNDVIDELDREGSKLVPETKDSQYFDVSPNPFTGSEKNVYYIKKKYYTPQNLEQGKKFFELNCAVCHGNDADGTGARAGIMVDAKPRMLTNFDWIDTRDDLRLLRSIKFGVTGTSMTPWGDFTSSLQRMQLVMYIRSLTLDKKARDELIESLYKAFVVPAAQIDQYRTKQDESLKELESSLNGVKAKQMAAVKSAQENAKDMTAALDLYKIELETNAKIKDQKAQDASFAYAKKLIDQRREIFLAIGNDIINAGLGETPLFDQYLKMIPFASLKVKFDDGKISIENSKENQAKVNAIKDGMVLSIESKIKSLENEKEILKGKLPSPQVDKQKSEISARLASYNKIKAKLLSGLAELEGGD